MLADLHTAAISNPGFNWSVSPSVTELEIIMCDWVAKMLGLSTEFTSASASGLGGGIILNSASEVAITVAIAARERALTRIESLEAWRRIKEHESLLVLYGTTQTHSIAAKAALILGISFRALKVFAKDEYALQGETLKAAIEEDRAAGRYPFMLVATLGTTSSCAIDNMTEIAQVAKSYPELWIHVDSAYAGVALTLPEERAKMDIAAINECVDSFSTNLHKWGLVQFDCSPLHVKDRGLHCWRLSARPERLMPCTGTVLDLRNMSLSLGRRFRSLKVWFVLRSYGLQGLRNHLRGS
ncbi:hypothetical protein L7F22_013720 [Adiantum nelumboides]|nr:hypothetical protein [Adiantum nelumboides]